MVSINTSDKMANIIAEGDQDGGGVGLFYVGPQVGIF